MINITIYADILVLVNIYIDFFIILAVKRFFHIYVKAYRIILGAVLGGFCGLLGLIPMPFFLSLIILFICGLLICLVVFYDKNPITYIKTSACFFTFSMIFSGFVLVMVEVFGLRASVTRGVVYFDISPIMLVIFTGLAYLVSLLLERLKGRKPLSQEFCRITLEHGGREVKLLALTDTGNSLKEPFSGTPVVVVERKAVEELLPDEIKTYLDQGRTTGSFRLVPFSSIGGRGLLPAFKPHQVYFSETKGQIDCFVAIYSGKLNMASINAIIDPDIAEFTRGKDVTLHEKAS